MAVQLESGKHRIKIAIAKHTAPHRHVFSVVPLQKQNVKRRFKKYDSSIASHMQHARPSRPSYAVCTISFRHRCHLEGAENLG